MTADKAKSIILETLSKTVNDCSIGEYRELLGDLIDDFTDRFNAADDIDDNAEDEG